MSLLGFQRRRRELAAKEAAEREAAEKAAVEEKPLDKMTVDELKQYAADNGIDLGDATKKADILAAIKSESDEQPEAESRKE